MRGYVLGGQVDRKGETPWPIHEGPSECDADANLGRGDLHLHHTAEDHARGLRAYCKDVMDGLKGNHEDWQIANKASAALEAYLTKYPVKYSTSATDEWFSGTASGEGMAATLLFR